MNIEKQRQDFLAAIYGLGNQKRRTLWAECGYPQNLSFKHYYKAYTRNSVGFAAVTRLSDGCWVDVPTIVDGAKDNESNKTSAWEKRADKLFKKLWKSIKEADKRNLVGQYSALIIQVREEGVTKWEDELLPGSLAKLEELALVKLIPVWQEQLTVAEYQIDLNKEDYGEPVYYQFNESAVGKSKKGRSIKIHKSRIILLNEGGDDNQPETGIPLLEPGYNKLLDLEKTSGGSAEGFLKNASRQLSIKMSDNVDLRELKRQAEAMGYKDVAGSINDQIQRLNNGIDSALITQEGDTSVLSVAAADPTSTWTVAANEFAASIQIPFTILFGQQTGRLASDEDKTDWANRCNGRRNGFLSEVITQILERFWTVGIIPPPKSGEVTISWSDLLAPSERDKIANAKELAAVATTSQSAYGMSVIKPNEIREVLGYEPLKDDEMPPTVKEEIDPLDYQQEDKTPTDTEE